MLGMEEPQQPVPSLLLCIMGLSGMADQPVSAETALLLSRAWLSDLCSNAAGLAG